MANFIEKIFRIEARVLKKYEKEADKVISFEEQMKALSDDELRAKTPYFKDLLEKGATLDQIKETRPLKRGFFRISFSLWEYGEYDFRISSS